MDGRHLQATRTADGSQALIGAQTTGKGAEMNNRDGDFGGDFQAMKNSRICVRRISTYQKSWCGRDIALGREASFYSWDHAVRSTLRGQVCGQCKRQLFDLLNEPVTAEQRDE